MNRNLYEDSRSQLLSKSKKADNYVPSNQSKGKNRYERRLHSKVFHSVKDYNNINMNRLFKDNILDVNVSVHGETDDYSVKMSFGGFLDSLHRELKKNNDILNLRVVSRALTSAFNSDNVYIHCSCLHPTTKIRLLDGTSPTVEELLERFSKGEKLYVYSTDAKGDFKPGEVENVWITKYTTEFIRVTLDNGEELLTTPDHLYMLRTGEYIQAQLLEPGVSLMPMYNMYNNGYEAVKLNSTGRYHSTYKIVANEYYLDDITEAKCRALNQREEGYNNMKYDVAIHHRDFNKLNNNPENLQIMTSREHWDYHASLGFDSFSDEVKLKIKEISRQNAIKRNQNPTENMLRSRKAFLEAGRLRNYDEDRKLQQSQIMRDTMKNYYATITEEDKKYLFEVRSKNSKKAWENGCFNTEKFHEAAVKRGEFLHTEEVEKLAHEGILRYWDNLSEEERASRASISRKNIQKSIENRRGTPLSESHKEHIRQSRLNESPEQKEQHNRKISEKKVLNILKKVIDNGLPLTEDNYNLYRTNGYPKVTTIFSSIEEAVSYFELNHKVIKVEKITLDETPVYDISVKDYHNFVVDAGVVLHNCPDFRYRFSYWATKNSITSGQAELRPANITNPGDTKGSGCKHVMLVLSNNSWLLKVSSVIFNYINYMEKHYAKLYADIIYPAIYEKDYEEPVQMDMFADEENPELATDSDTIDTSNKYARTKTQFKKGNEYRFKPNQQVDKQLDFDSLLDDEENTEEQ